MSSNTSPRDQPSPATPQPQQTSSPLCAPPFLPFLVPQWFDSSPTDVLFSNNLPHSPNGSSVARVGRPGTRREDVSFQTCQWEDCSRNFPTKEALVEHVNSTHMKDMEQRIQLRCKWADCGRRTKFTTLQNLKTHLKTHTQEKPFKCQYPGCRREFRLKNCLARHRQTHDVEQHVCDFPWCQMRFISAFDRDKHFRNTHAEKRFACSVECCFMSYVDVRSLQKHVTTTHGKEEYEATQESESSSSSLDNPLVDNTQTAKRPRDTKSFMISDILELADDQ